MKETIDLLILLGLSVIGNILGGVYVNINLNKIEFDWKKLVTGLIKAACVTSMFLILALVVENMPSVTESIGVEPKALIVGAIAIYSTKIVGHLTTIFGYKKQDLKTSVVENEKVEIKEEKLDEEFVDI